MKTVHTITSDFPILHTPAQLQKGEENYFNYKVDKQKTLSIKKGKQIFIDENGYVFNQYEIFPVSFFLRKKLKWFPSVKHIYKSLMNKNRIKIEEGIWVYDIWALGYFHWFSDALHRYFQIINKIKKKVPLILPAALNKQKYIVNSLALLEVEVFWIEPKSLALVEQLYTIDYLHCPGTFTVAAMKTLRAEILNRIAHKKEQSGRKLYISRAKAKIRKVANEEALIPILLKNGFEIYHLEDLTWTDQVRLLSSANTLMSMHGAGLTNMMWMPTESQVIEIRMKESFDQWCYYELAATYGHRYSYLLCDASQEEATPHDGDVIVSLKELETQLDAIQHRYK